MNAFVRPRRIDDPALRLVVFHHAGGSAAAYFPMTRFLPADWDILLADLPGRGKRHAEPPLEDMPLISAGSAREVLPFADGPPLALFGHSMGAVVAYETARILQARGAGPAWVGLSGRAAPGPREPGTCQPEPELSDGALMDLLSRMGGMHPRMAELPDYQARFLRLVRSDLRALAAYRPDPESEPLTAPLTVFGAGQDDWAPPQSMDGWAGRTRGGFRARRYAGGHFHFLGSAFADFTADVTAEIRRAVPVAEPGALRTAGEFARTRA